MRDSERKDGRRDMDEDLNVTMAAGWSLASCPEEVHLS